MCWCAVKKLLTHSLMSRYAAVYVKPLRHRTKPDFKFHSAGARDASPTQSQNALIHIAANRLDSQNDYNDDIPQQRRPLLSNAAQSKPWHSLVVTALPAVNHFGSQFTNFWFDGLISVTEIYNAPTSEGGAIDNDGRRLSVRLFVCRVPRTNSRTERPRKPKIGRVKGWWKPITRITREPI